VENIKYIIIFLLGYFSISKLVIADENKKNISFVSDVFFSSRSFEYSAYPTKIKSTISSVGIGLTAKINDFYTKLSIEQNLTASESNFTLSNNKINTERKDLSISVGYAIVPTITIFTGYKYGKTTFNELALDLIGKGPFIGAGAGWQVKGNNKLTQGFFSLSAAYAYMDADYQTYTNITTGKASGTSLSIAWNSNISKNIYYNLALIRHDYFYEKFDNLDTDISENILSLRAGLSYRF
jgi:hypothetical protein